MKARSEFYDLNQDPHELRNLFQDDAYQTQIEELTARIHAWQHLTNDTGVSLKRI